MKFALTLSAIIVAISSGAQAGSPGGPRLVWVNLEDDPFATTALRDFVESQPDDRYCDGSGYGLLFYVNKRPAGITNQLVKEALVDTSPTAKRKLAKLLLRFRDDDEDIKDGLDGVIAIADAGGRHLVSMDVKGAIQISKVIPARSRTPLIKALCNITPLIYRDRGDGPRR